MGEAGGRRASAPRAPAPPRPRRPGGSGSRTRPGLPGSHWLLRPPVKAGAWGAGARAAAAGTGRVLGARRGAPLLPAWPASPGQRPTRLGPSPPDAPPRPDVGGCGGRAAARGRRRGGKRFLPFPGAQGSSCGRFYLRSQTKFTAAAAAFPRSAPARVKRPSWRAAGTPACGPGAAERGANAGVTWPGGGAPPATPHPHPCTPGVACCTLRAR